MARRRRRPVIMLAIPAAGAAAAIALAAAGSQPAAQARTVRAGTARVGTARVGTARAGTAQAGTPQAVDAPARTAPARTAPARTAYNLTGVSCKGPASCLAVGARSVGQTGNYALGEAWNGRSWRVLKTPDPAPRGELSQLTGVSCATASRCMDVGYYASRPGITVNLAELRTGSSWRVLRPANPRTGRSELVAVSCPRPSYCMTTGAYYVPRHAPQYGWAEAWRHGRWRELRTAVPPDGTAAALDAVSCASPVRCMAAGSYTRTNTGNRLLPILEAWDGTRWRLLSIPAPPGQGAGLAYLTGISCAPAGGCLAVGSYGASNRAFAARWNGSTWRLIRLPGSAASMVPQAVSCAARSSCMIVGYLGSRTLAAAWNGRAWRAVAMPAPQPASILSALACGSAASCLAIGTYDTSSNYSAAWDGSSWRALPAPNPERHARA